MSILVFQHDPETPVGRLGLTLRDHGFKLDIRRVDLPPAPVGMPERDIIAGGFGRPIPPDYDNVEGIVVLGGEQNVTDIAKYPWMQREAEYIKGAHQRAIPIIGICLGHQLIAHALGGKVAKAATPEWGLHRVTLPVPGQTETILSGIPWNHIQFQAHNEEVTDLPPGATLLGSSKACKNQIFKHGLRTYGFQFHFECDRPAIERVMRNAPGGAPADLAQQLEAHYPDFARVADRLCVNLVSYLLPLQMMKKSGAA